MDIKLFFGIMGLVATLTACGVHADLPVDARDNGGKPGNGNDPAKKPDPTPAKVVELIRALQFQKPTLDEADFLNLMDMDLTEGDRALFSFSFAPDKNGTFYFSLAQTRLLLKECAKPPERSYKLRIFWQEVKGGKRVILKEFKPNIDSFDFKKENTYLLTYALMDLKEFSDCKAATLKFATFLKDYK